MFFINPIELLIQFEFTSYIFVGFGLLGVCYLVQRLVGLRR